jgi:PEP-CTERM motif
MRKISMKAAFAAVGLGAAALMASAPAHAGLVSTDQLGITFTITDPSGVAGNDASTLNPTNYGFSGQFTLFNTGVAQAKDANCGTAGYTCTLTSAEIFITGNTGGTIAFGNNTGSSGAINAGSQFGATITVYTPFGTQIIATPAVTVSSNINCAPNTPTCASISTSANASANSGAITSGAALSSLTGTGSTTIAGDTADSLTDLHLSGSVGSTPNITADVTGYIVYTFDEEPVNTPEPATLALFGVGLTGIAFLRRRQAGK